MRILFATEYFPPFVPGGAEWSTRRWAEVLSALGHEVIVGTVNYGAESREKMNGVHVHRAPFPFKVRSSQASAPAWSTTNPLFQLYFAAFLYGLARRADVVHAQTHNVVLPAWMAARLARRPFFLTLRDLGMLCPIAVCLLQGSTVPPDCGWRRLMGPDARFYQRHYMRRQGGLARLKLRLQLTYLWNLVRLKKYVLNRADGIVSVSQGLADVFPEHMLWRRERLHILPNPAPDPRERAGAGKAEAPGILEDRRLTGKRLVLTVGKMSLGKGTYVLLEAARRLADQAQDVAFVMVGKGRIHPAEVPANVVVLGSRPHSEVMTLYSRAELVVVPSIWPEPLSRVILEVLSFGKPVVATAVGGNFEALGGGRTGLLVPPGDPHALAEGIRKVLGDPTFAEVARREGASILREDFEPDSLARRLVRIYEGFLEGRRPLADGSGGHFPPA